MARIRSRATSAHSGSSTYGLSDIGVSSRDNGVQVAELGGERGREVAQHLQDAGPVADVQALPGGNERHRLVGDDVYLALTAPVPELLEPLRDAAPGLHRVASIWSAILDTLRCAQ